MAFPSRAEGPWGAPVLKRVQSDLLKGWPAGLTVLTGDDLFHLDRAQDAILSHLVPDRADSFAWSIVGDASLSTGALVGSARSSGMFASRRVVFVRDVGLLEGDPEPLAAYAKNPPKDSFIVVRAPRLDRKRKLHKALAEAGTCLAFRRAAGESEARELAAVVKTLAAGAGVTLEDAAAALLVDVCGSDLHRIAAEIEKLATWLGRDAPQRRVDTASVRDLVAGSGLLSGWELADAVTAREPEEAIAAARRLLDAGEEPIRMLGGLASRARSLLRAKAMTEAGASPRDVVDAARAWYYRDALARGVKRYAPAELLALPSKLYEADRTFKSRGLDKGAVLEALVIDVTIPSSERR